MPDAYLEFKRPDLRAGPHKKLIDVYSFALVKSGSGKSGSGGGVTEVFITRYLDEASPKIQLANVNYTRFDEVILTVHRTEEAEPYLAITMMQTDISGYRFADSPQDGKGIEMFTLNFTTVKLVQP